MIFTNQTQMQHHNNVSHNNNTMTTTMLPPITQQQKQQQKQNTNKIQTCMQPYTKRTSTDKKNRGGRPIGLWIGHLSVWKRI